MNRLLIILALTVCHSCATVKPKPLGRCFINRTFQTVSTGTGKKIIKVGTFVCELEEK